MKAKTVVAGLAMGLVLAAVFIGVIDAMNGDPTILLVLGATVLAVLFLGVNWPRRA